MGTEESTKSHGAVSAILAALPSEVKGALSGMLLFFAFFAMMYALINMPAYFKNLVSASSAKEFCWELKEAQGVAFKFNKCTGEAIQLDIKFDASPAKTPLPVIKP